MRTTIAALCSVLAAGAIAVSVARADDKKKEEKPAAAAEAAPVEKAVPAEGEVKAPETLKFEKTGKMAPVAFPHKKHIDKLGGCKDCHEGEKPLFEQKRGEKGLTMKDMYAGAACGKCHDGKKTFAAKTGCMKCHKKTDK
ncbi:MAG: hypothetical protein HY925_08545 [Elusimicrobia bacterium]|nr:hypothetical protein [Elusimicrobiota bacterium]